jgi:hypothetical protein
VDWRAVVMGHTEVWGASFAEARGQIRGLSGAALFYEIDQYDEVLETRSGGLLRITSVGLSQKKASSP